MMALLYRAGKHDCDSPSLSRVAVRRARPQGSIYENARDVARDIAKTEIYMTPRRERKKIKMLFAHLKRCLRLDGSG
jgi:hypothetical protein